MSSVASVEAIEQQLLDEAEHAGSLRAYSIKRAALNVAEETYEQFPNTDNLTIVNAMRRRVRAAHRALFRVVG